MPKSKNAEDDEFVEEETVLGFHGPLLYPAKVLQVDSKNKAKKQYYVHYQGWSKKWDEWVESDRLLKDNPENRKHASELKDKVKAEKKNKRKSESKKEGKGKKRSKKDGDGEEDEDDDAVDEETVEPDETRVERKEIKIKIPGALKKQLITDWENITKNQKLVPLPREPSVNLILEEFVKSKKTKSAQAEAMTREVIDGIRQYFEKALGKVLLYKFERPQYQEILEKYKDEKQISDVYGAEHLLRLFVKIPGLLGHTQMEQKEATALSTKLSEFLKWLQKKTDFFANEYRATDKEYAKKAEIK